MSKRLKDFEPRWIANRLAAQVNEMPIMDRSIFISTLFDSFGNGVSYSLWFSTKYTLPPDIGFYLIINCDGEWKRGFWNGKRWFGSDGTGVWADKLPLPEYWAQVEQPK